LTRGDPSNDLAHDDARMAHANLRFFNRYPHPVAFRWDAVKLAVGSQRGLCAPPQPWVEIGSMQALQALWEYEFSPDVNDEADVSIRVEPIFRGIRDRTEGEVPPLAIRLPLR
jgi:hypothetical protein